MLVKLTLYLEILENSAFEANVPYLFVYPVSSSNYMILWYFYLDKIRIYLSR